MDDTLQTYYVYVCTTDAWSTRCSGECGESEGVGRSPGLEEHGEFELFLASITCYSSGVLTSLIFSYPCLFNFDSCQQYASASWTRPSGEQGSNALFFPTSQGLTGAVFPVTGLPELPKPSSIAAALPAEVRARMQQIPPDQMELLLTQLRKQRDGAMTNQGATASASGGATDSSINTGSFGNSLNLSQNQLQQQSDLDGGIAGSGASTFGGNGNGSNNYGGGLNMMNTVGIGLGQPQNVTGLSATLPQPVSVSGGTVHGGVGPGPGIGSGNVSYEMMKSFIQRGGGNVGISGQSQG